MSYKVGSKVRVDHFDFKGNGIIVSREAMNGWNSGYYMYTIQPCDHEFNYLPQKTFETRCDRLEYVLEPENERPEKANPEPINTDTNLVTAITDVINLHCRENDSETPDFILGEYLLDCLKAFEKATKERNAWSWYLK